MSLIESPGPRESDPSLNGTIAEVREALAKNEAAHAVLVDLVRVYERLLRLPKYGGKS